MAGSNLKIDIRRGKILEKLRLNGRVYVSELSEELGATPVTIRTDLAALEGEGYLVRMSGGAVPSGSTDGLQVGSSEKLRERYAEKIAIARAVVGMIKDGEALFINSGSTTQYIASELKVRKNLNIVTNSLAVASMLGSHPTFRVILLGGEINAQHGFTCGGDAQEQMSRYKADCAVLSVDSISRDGVTTCHAEEAIIDRMMISGAKRTLIAADCTKIGRDGFTRVCECSAITRLVTNTSASDSAIESIAECGVDVVRV